MTFPPDTPDEEYINLPWADSQKFCRTYGVSGCGSTHALHLHVPTALAGSTVSRDMWLAGPPACLAGTALPLRDNATRLLLSTPQAELPSLTDTYTREVLISEYNADLPPYMWLGLRSYGDGKVWPQELHVSWEARMPLAPACTHTWPSYRYMFTQLCRCSTVRRAFVPAQLFWSDGSFTADGLLDAWGPGEFGDHACAIIVGPNGANVTLLVSASTAGWGCQGSLAVS
jgi:hypothetical protein